MKTRIVLLIALVLTLLLSGVALRWAQGVAQAQGGDGGSVAAQSNPAMLSGGRYRLASLSAQASVIASGGGYRLLEPASPGGGNQCCCTFLPCVMRR